MTNTALSMTTSLLTRLSGLVLIASISGCLSFPPDRRDVHVITDWTLNTESCEAEGADVRASRTSTHLLINPLGREDDQEAIVTTCVRAPGEADCGSVGSDVDYAAEISLQMERQPDGSYEAHYSVLDGADVCSGEVIDATLTFPVAQRFRLEIRRSRFDLAAPADCYQELSAAADLAGCSELEVLHGDFELVVEAEHEWSSSDSDADDDFDESWD
jgi:hypothetical protein